MIISRRLTLFLVIISFFTIASNAQSPGGVSTGLVLWNKANAGVSVSGSNVTAWSDQTAGNTFTITGTPVLQSNMINYNPDILFNGSSRLTGNTSITNITEAYAVAKIVNGTGISTSGAVIGNTAAAGYNYFFHTEGGFLYTSGGTGTYSSTNLFGNNVPYCIMDADHSETPAASSQIKINGLAQTNIAGGDPIVFSAVPTIGSRTTEDILNGSEIAEVIIYNQSTAGTSRTKVLSYLALKYGITLGNVSNLVNYTSSNGTVFWTGSSTYQNDVFGIGTDNGSALTQTVSNSTNNGSGNGGGQSGKGNIILTTLSALTNQQFLMIGDDAGTLTEQTSNVPAAATGSTRLKRNWLSQNTGSAGTVNLSFDMTGLTLTGGSTASKYRLMVNSNTDASFATGTATYYTPSSIAGNLINFTGISLPNNTVFTIITNASPITLAADWLSFTATKQGNDALLKWSTTNEANVGYYEAEQSPDGSNFLPVGKLAPVNSVLINNYSLQVPLPANGISYFRIKRVDMDGRSFYSTIQKIETVASFSVSIQPNLVTDNMLNVYISSPTEVQATIYILGMDGRVLLQQGIAVPDGETIKVIDITRLAPGSYITKVLVNNNWVTCKFIKQ